MQRWAEVGLVALIATGLACSDSDPPSEPPDEPSPPDAPLGMDATSGAAPNSILLDWNPVAGATSYRVYYSSASPFPLGGAVRFDVSAPPATVTGLSANVPHHFSVVAIGSGGESPRSLTATATPRGTLFASILEPVAFGIVGDTLQVRASVAGSSIPTSVVASLRERSIPLTAPPQGSSVWSGSLVVSGAPSPESTYVSLTAVTATDSVTAYTPVLHDVKPHLQFTPFPGGVVGLSPHFSIRCLDDEAASCGIRVWAEGGSRELISAQGEIDQEISLADYAEQSTDLVIIVQDRAGQTARADQRVAVTTNPNLVLLGTAGATLLDADANSLLALDTSGGGRRILLVDRLGASTDTILSELPAGATVRAAVSGGSAVVQVSTSNPVAMAVHEWRGGQLTTISTSAGLTVLDQIATSGPWAIWTRRFGGSGTLIRRNFVTGTGDTLATNAGGQAYDVTATGDVAYWTDDLQVHLLHNGTDTQITTMGSNLYPQTDGVRTVYLSGGGDHGDILLHENGEIDTLALDAGALAYDVANGWVAFMRPLPGGNAQVWVRSPDGQLRALSPAGQFVTFKAVGDSGDVIYESQNQGWRVKAGGMPESVGPSGRYLFIGGQLHVIIGASLFAIH